MRTSVVRIDVLDHKDRGVARQIHAVLIPAYAQEAALLRTSDFPPLDRTVEDVQAEEGRYLGAIEEKVVVGALHYEPDDEPGQMLISSLVVDPKHQRQGIASALISEVLRIEDRAVFAVSTGARNMPAIGLYRRFGFEEYRFGTIGPEALPLVKLRRTTSQATAHSTSMTTRLMPDEVLRNYFRAKDENRPHLLESVFAREATLEVLNRASTIHFPARTEGRDAIADVMVRDFGRVYENVYSFYLERPGSAVAAFSCDWLVAMSDKESRNVRVGCGRYDWTFDAGGSGLATGLVITIEAMQLLPPNTFEPVFGWVRQLTYPWTGVPAIKESSPPVEWLEPVLRYLCRPGA